MDNSEYNKLLEMERLPNSMGAAIVKVETGEEGIAGTCGEEVSVWYGSDDGSDDKTISIKEFTRFFRVTGFVDTDGNAVIM